MLKFKEELKKLNLEKGRYALFGSSTLAIRGLRENKDIDIVVTQDYLDELAKKYHLDKREVIDLGDVELFSDWDGNIVKPWIDEAEIIDGIPFVKLEHVIKFKKKRNKPKDQNDIKLIEEYLDKKSKSL